jgi:hypothetical protein
MEANSVVAGKRLLDALDVHWYPQAMDSAPWNSGNRILNNVSTTAMYNARMQAPRTLWDTSYVGTNGENSWINQWYSGYLPLIPRLKNDIKTYYPDTNLTFTEYAYGPDSTTSQPYQHWSTGIATADVLGIFGKYGVYLATYWGGGDYVDAAVKLYRNYDGNHSTFGDMNVIASMSDKVNSSIYASEFKGYTCEMHMIVINKSQDSNITGTFNITSSQHFNSGRVWHFDNSSTTISETTAINSITNNSFIYTIPATTVCHMVLQASPPDWDINGPSGVSDCHVNIWDLKDFTSTWLNSYTFVDFAHFAQQWGM